VFRALGLDADPVRGEVQDSRQFRRHVGNVARQSWRLSEHGGVDVDEPGRVRLDKGAHRSQEFQARDAAVSRIAIWKVMAQITQRKGAQQRFGNGMGQDIRVGVSVQPPIRRDRHPAEHERPARDQRMQIHPEPNPIHRIPRGRSVPCCAAN
jgi:hypothetical protein